MSDNKPSFIKIAPGAKVTGLVATNNTMHGHGDFINNEGTLEDAKLKNNRHIIPNEPHVSPTKQWYEKPLGIFFLAVVGAVVSGGLIYYFGWH